MTTYCICFPCAKFEIHNIRWPWALFKLLQGDIDISSSMRKSIAMKLLRAADIELDHTTAKIRRMCLSDIKEVEKSGRVQRGSKLHGILSIVGLHLKLDAGELESLNSQIKSTIGQGSTNMSLELLSSRVITRKMLTMGVVGRPTFKTLKPLAERIASHATLYQGCESDIMVDSERWTVPTPLNLSSRSPSEYDPSLQLTESDRWGIKFNKLLMKALRLHQKDNMSIFTLGFCFRRTTHDSAYIVGELAGRTCQVQVLEAVRLQQREAIDALVEVNAENTDDEHSIQQQLWQLPKTLEFQPSVSVIGQQFQDVIDGANVDLLLIELCICTESETVYPTRVQYKLGKSYYIAKLVKRKTYTRRQQQHEFGALGEGSTNSNDNVDNDDIPSDDNVHDGMYDADNDTDLGLVEEIEREMFGGDCDIGDDFENELKETELGQDLFTMDELNQRFVEAARNRQDETGFCNTTNPRVTADSSHGTRTFEDELGELLLQELLHGEGELERHDSKKQSSQDVGSSSWHPELDDTQTQDALRHWSQQICKFNECCAEMALVLGRFDPKNVGAGLNREVSLLLHGTNTYDEVSFVTWVKPYAKLEGRCVSLDETSSLVYPSHFIHKTNFSDSIVILPHCGARIKKQERDQVPAVALRLQKSFSVGLARLVFSTLDTGNNSDILECMNDDALGSTCVACGHGTTHAMLFQCAACLLWWHRECSDALGPSVNNYVQSHDVTMLKDLDVGIGDIPFILLYLSYNSIGHWTIGQLVFRL